MFLAELVLPGRRYRKSVLAGLGRPAWTSTIPWKFGRRAILQWSKYELSFPVLLINLHQWVGQFWSYQYGPYYSMSISTVIMYGDSLLCTMMTCAWAVAHRMAEAGHSIDAGEVVYQWLLKLLARLPSPVKFRVDGVLGGAEDWYDAWRPTWLPKMHRGHAVMWTFGAVAGFIALVVEAQPSPSPTVHRLIVLYDAPHVLLFALVVSSGVGMLVRGKWLYDHHMLDRGYVACYVIALACLVGYFVIAYVHPDAYRFILGWARMNLGWFGRKFEEFAFDWHPMRVSWKDLPR